MFTFKSITSVTCCVAILLCSQRVYDRFHNHKTYAALDHCHSNIRYTNDLIGERCSTSEQIAHNPTDIQTHMSLFIECFPMVVNVGVLSSTVGATMMYGARLYWWYK